MAPEQALGREHAQHPLAVGGEAADREHRVDAVHDELEPAGRRVEVDPAADADLDAVGELDARDLLEGPGDRGAVVAEERDPERGADPVAVAVLLDELEVDVLVARGVELLDLAAYPDLAREGVDQRLGDRLVQLADRERGLVHLLSEASWRSP